MATRIVLTLDDVREEFPRSGGVAGLEAVGCGVLALALAPPLQRFGLVTGLSIIFAFVACLTVLPCLLVVRERILERFGSTGST